MQPTLPTDYSFPPLWKEMTLQHYKRHIFLFRSNGKFIKFNRDLLQLWTSRLKTWPTFQFTGAFWKPASLALPLTPRRTLKIHFDVYNLAADACIYIH